MEKLCNICPRNCNVNRDEKLGFCKSSNKIKISKVMKHYFEEPPISGISSRKQKSNGSGAIFFSNCNLKCVFCQNSQISNDGLGKEISVESLANIFKQLEQANVYNINLVSPTHYTNQILEALKIYKPKIPIVWNTSGYEKPETIKMLDGFVDIFLTDFKYFNEDVSLNLASAKNYKEFCTKSILQMRKNLPSDIFDENGIMQKGIIIRNLVLPNHTDDSLKIIDWINQNLGNKTYISLMAQYVPMFKAKNIEKINRKIKPLEYKVLVNKLKSLGFTNVFLQDFASANCIYTPDFLDEKSEFKY